MAKKRAPGGKRTDDRQPRKENYTPARLAAVVERIREEAARLSGLARSMEDAQVGEVAVDGHAMLQRGLNQIENFIDNASRAIREAKVRNMPM